MNVIIFYVLNREIILFQLQSTPVGIKAMGLQTPMPGQLAAMTPEQLQAYRWEKEIDERNRPFTDDELEAMFPPGYKILPPPAGLSNYVYFKILGIYSNENNNNYLIFRLCTDKNTCEKIDSNTNTWCWNTSRFFLPSRRTWWRF